MREIDVVRRACGLGSFPYIAFPPIALANPDYRSSPPQLEADMAAEEMVVPAEPVTDRREPVLASALPIPLLHVEPPPTPALPPQVIAHLVPVATPLAIENAPPSCPAPPFQILTELQYAAGRTPRRPLHREPRAAAKPAAKIVLAKSQRT